MPSEYGELRYDSPDLVLDARRVAKVLDEHGRVAFRYAAFGTLHCFIAMDSRQLVTQPYERDPERELWVGPYGPPGVNPALNTHTLWVRQNSNVGTSTWLNRAGYHDPMYLVEKLQGDAINPTDALGLGVLFLLIETGRGLVYDIIPTITKWIEQLEGEKEMPAFVTEGTQA